MRVLVPAAAVLVCAFALYFSHGVLDQVVADGGAMRVALVPAWPVLAAFFAMSATAVLWLTRRAMPRTVTSLPVRQRVSALILPVFGLAFLIIPYLPYLSDWMPALQMLAGPFKWVVWLTAGGLLGWTLWQTRIARADWLARATPLQAAIAIGLLTAIVAALAAVRLSGTLAFAASANNDGQSIALTALTPPVHGVGGYWRIVIALILCAGGAAAIAWHAIVRATNSPAAATFAWAAVALTTPFVFTTFTPHPEIVAALAVAIAFGLIAGHEPQTDAIGRWLAFGAACAALPWVSARYILMSAVLVGIGAARLLRRRDSTSAVVVAGMYVVSLAAWLAFLYVSTGTPLPASAADVAAQTNIRNLGSGVAGLLFDQEFGVLAYAPVYILAAAGLIQMWRAGDELRRRAIEITIIFATLLGTIAALRSWWGAAAAPGSALAPGLLLLSFPIAVAVRSAPPGSARRAAHHVLLWISVGIAATLVVAQYGLLIGNSGDGTSTLLEYWSPWWSVWSVAPTFVLSDTWIAWLHVTVWLVAALIGAWMLSRWPTRTTGGAALAAIITLAGVLMMLSIVVPWLPRHGATRGVTLMARSRLALLDGFDTTSRPIGVRYDPFHFEPAEAIVAGAVVGVRPGTRPDSQPVRVLHNGRFSLPAGHYRADLEWVSAIEGSAPIGLQIGRIEPVWQTWQVQPRSGAHWAVDFDLPVDANFVGFRGGPDVERAIGQLTIRALSVINESARPNVPSVLATWQYGEATAMFHDENSAPEPKGFWVLGRETAKLTIVRATDQTPLTLRLHSGPEPNRVRIAMRGWQQTLQLAAHTPQEITLPDSNRRLVTIDVHPEDGFSPGQYSPSNDARFLGAWVEIVGN
jgi:hypothetical protein